METQTNKKTARRLVGLCVAVYFASYVTRINFATVISEFIRAEGLTKSGTAVILTAMSVTYGFGQLLSGFLGDKTDPRFLICIGLFTSVIMNLLMPLCSPHIPLMTAVWAVNGLAQAFMWPPLTRILFSALSGEQYLKAAPMFGFSTGGGSIAVYLAAPFLIRWQGWKPVFLFSAAIGLAVALIWLFASGKLLKGVTYQQKRVSSGGADRHRFSLGIPVVLMGSILISIIIQGALRDGITTWTPNLLADLFRLDSGTSILISVVMPLFHLVCNFFAYRYLSWRHHDVFRCVADYFILLGVLILLLLTVGDSSVFVAVPLLALISAAVHGVNTLQTCCIQQYFRRTGWMALLSGILNCATYLGSSAATYLFALSADHGGWDMTMGLWAVLCVGGVLFTVISGDLCRRNGFAYYEG